MTPGQSRSHTEIAGARTGDLFGHALRYSQRCCMRAYAHDACVHMYTLHAHMYTHKHCQVTRPLPPSMTASMQDCLYPCAHAHTHTRKHRQVVRPLRSSTRDCLYERPPLSMTHTTPSIHDTRHTRTHAKHRQVVPSEVLRPYHHVHRAVRQQGFVPPVAVAGAQPPPHPRPPPPPLTC